MKLPVVALVLATSDGGVNVNVQVGPGGAGAGGAVGGAGALGKLNWFETALLVVPPRPNATTLAS